MFFYPKKSSVVIKFNRNMGAHIQYDHQGNYDSLLAIYWTYIAYVLEHGIADKEQIYNFSKLRHGEAESSALEPAIYFSKYKKDINIVNELNGFEVDEYVQIIFSENKKGSRYKIKLDTSFKKSSEHILYSIYYLFEKLKDLNKDDLSFGVVVANKICDFHKKNPNDSYKNIMKKVFRKLNDDAIDIGAKILFG